VITDTEYLTKQLGREPTEDEKYNFIERVGMILDRSEIEEDEARKIAMNYIGGGK
jgi:hypothetical protein